MRLTALAHALAAERLAEGDLAVDATAGNGHDTKFLAEQCGDSGHVWAFDIQDRAIAATKARLDKHALTGRVTLMQADNAEITERLPKFAQGNIALIIANLGYLPGGDTAVMTSSANTLKMMDSALTLLRPEGMLIITAYPGHDGGDIEAETVYARLRLFESAGHTLRIHGDPLAPARRPWLAEIVKHPTLKQ